MGNESETTPNRQPAPRRGTGAGSATATTPDASGVDAASQSAASRDAQRQAGPATGATGSTGVGGPGPRTPGAAAAADETRLRAVTNPTPEEVAATRGIVEPRVRDAQWETIRSRVRSALVASIGQRQTQRAAGTTPELTGIGSRLAMSRFVGAMRAGVQGRWPQLSARERAREAGRLAGDELQAAGVPRLLRSDIEEMMARASFRSGDWSIRLSRRIMSRPTVDDAAAAEVAEFTYHEARHAEQHFHVLQDLASGGLAAGAIQRQGSVPSSIAQAAHAAPRAADPQTAELRRSMLTEREQSGRVTEDVETQVGLLNTRRTECEQALAALAARPSETTMRAVWAAYDELGAQVARVEAAYRAYIALPHESDAHEVGGATGLAYQSGGTTGGGSTP